MYNKGQVLLIPTGEKGKKDQLVIVEDKGKDKVLFTSWMDAQLSLGYYLYVVSNEKINLGDYYVDSRNQYKICQYKDSTVILPDYGVRKIEASNNRDLIQKYTILVESLDIDFKKVSITEIPDNFINYYISEYNKGNIITDVLINKISNKDGSNQIIIKTIKNNWTRSELIEVLKSFADDCEHDEDLIWYHGRDENGKKILTNVDKWVEDNVNI